MSTKHRIDSDHYRVVSDDGRHSEVYRENGWFQNDTRVECAHHEKDGNTYAYDPPSLLGEFFGSKGNPK